jgi:hypothetical protein
VSHRTPSWLYHNYFPRFVRPSDGGQNHGSRAQGAQAILTTTVRLASSLSSSTSTSCRALLRSPTERALRHAVVVVVVVVVVVPCRCRPSALAIFNQGTKTITIFSAKAFCRGRRIEAPSSAFIVDDGAVRVLRKKHHCHQRRCPRRRRRPSVFVVWSSSSLLALIVGNSECT